MRSAGRSAAKSQAKMSSKISTSNFLLDGVVSNPNLRVVIYSGECILCLCFFGFEPEASPGEGLRLCFFIFCLSLFFLLSFGLRSMCGGTCIWLKSSSGLEVLIRSHWSFVQWGMTAFTNSYLVFCIKLFKQASFFQSWQLPEWSFAHPQAVTIPTAAKCVF